jgi:hypothetical protein
MPIEFPAVWQIEGHPVALMGRASGKNLTSPGPWVWEPTPKKPTLGPLFAKATSTIYVDLSSRAPRA